MLHITFSDLKYLVVATNDFSVSENFLQILKNFESIVKWADLSEYHEAIEKHDQGHTHHNSGLRFGISEAWPHHMSMTFFYCPTVKYSMHLN